MWEEPPTTGTKCPLSSEQLCSKRPRSLEAATDDQGRGGCGVVLSDLVGPVLPALTSEVFCAGRERSSCLWVYDGDDSMLPGDDQKKSYAALLGALRPKLKAGDHFLGRDLPEQPFVGAQLLLTGTCESKSGKSLCAPPQLAPSPESVAPWVAAFRDAHGVLNTHGGGGTVKARPLMELDDWSLSANGNIWSMRNGGNAMTPEALADGRSGTAALVEGQEVTMGDGSKYLLGRRAQVLSAWTVRIGEKGKQIAYSHVDEDGKLVGDNEFLTQPIKPRKDGDTRPLVKGSRVETEPGTVYVLGEPLLPSLEQWCITHEGTLRGAAHNKVDFEQGAMTTSAPIEPADARRTVAKGVEVKAGKVTWLLGEPTLPRLDDWRFDEYAKLRGKLSNDVCNPDGPANPAFTTERVEDADARAKAVEGTVIRTDESRSGKLYELGTPAEPEILINQEARRHPARPPPPLRAPIPPPSVACPSRPAPPTHTHDRAPAATRHALGRDCAVSAGSPSAPHAPEKPYAPEGGEGATSATRQGSTGPKVIDISKQFRDGPQFFRDGTVDLNPTRKLGTRANKGTRTKKPYNRGDAVKRLDAKKKR